MKSFFPPLADLRRFPLLTRGGEAPSSLACPDNLMFYAPENADLVQVITRGIEETEWSLYGDVRWPDEAVWIEFPACWSNRSMGVLVLRTALVGEEGLYADTLVEKNPLLHVLPEMRGPMMCVDLEEMYEDQFEEDERNGIIDDRDRDAAFIQGYVIYEGKPSGTGRYEIELIAAYTDLLNARGEVIEDYRFACADTRNIPPARFSLHALFRLNRARRQGTLFQRTPQLSAVAPAKADPSVVPPSWESYHPSRTLRCRPALRAMPVKKDMHKGLTMEDMQEMLKVRHQEINSELVAFSRAARQDAEMMMLMNEDVNTIMTTLLHRAQGGAIYVLPHRLVEEFHQTDCHEVRMSDLELPFPSVFLKFTPPEPLQFAAGAFVDGCYLIRQSNEYLLTLTSRRQGVDYAGSASVACMDSICALHLPATPTELTVTEAVVAGVERFLKENAPPQDDIGGHVDVPGLSGGTLVEDVRARNRRKRIAVFREQEPALRACLNIIINAACFISFYPEDITDEWDGSIPAPEVIAAAESKETSRGARDRRAGALQKLQQGDYTRIKVCGKSLFADPENHGPSTGDGKSPCAHWRRGHWRRQRYGTGFSRVYLRRIRPVLVMRDNGAPVEARIYEVDDPREGAVAP